MMVTAPATATTRRRPARSPQRSVVVAGHGGAGATTVAQLLGLSEARAGGVPGASLVVLAARTNLHGAQALRLALADRPPRPVLIVLTADAPLPRAPAVSAALRLLSDRIAQVHELPYVPAWRYGPAGAASASRAWRAAAAALVESHRRYTEQGGTA